MLIAFEILKLKNHHNRGQFIAARQLNFTEPLEIRDGSLLHGIPVFHYKEMYPLTKEAEPRFDIYIFRPIALGGYPEGLLYEGQVVELSL